MKKKIEEHCPVIWFTGLSGAGKTTLASRVAESLIEKEIRVEHLDGDIIRKIFSNTGFSPEERDQHIRRVAFIASLLARNGVTVIVSMISPFRESRKFAREQCEKFCEVYVSTPLEACENRDVKGLYKKARAGEVANFTGISSPYEPPLKPEISIDTARQSEDQCFKVISQYLESTYPNT